MTDLFFQRFRKRLRHVSFDQYSMMSNHVYEFSFGGVWLAPPSFLPNDYFKTENKIYHYNHNWNELIFEQEMRLPFSYSLNTKDEVPVSSSFSIYT